MAAPVPGTAIEVFNVLSGAAGDNTHALTLPGGGVDGLVLVLFYENGNADPTSMQYDGDAMTFIGSASNNAAAFYETVAAWRLDAPTTGSSANVTFNWTGGADALLVAVPITGMGATGATVVSEDYSGSGDLDLDIPHGDNALLLGGAVVNRSDSSVSNGASTTSEYEGDTTTGSSGFSCIVGSRSVVTAATSTLDIDTTAYHPRASLGFSIEEAAVSSPEADGTGNIGGTTPKVSASGSKVAGGDQAALAGTDAAVAGAKTAGGAQAALAGPDAAVAGAKAAGGAQAALAGTDAAVAGAKTAGGAQAAVAGPDAAVAGAKTAGGAGSILARAFSTVVSFVAVVAQSLSSARVSASGTKVSGGSGSVIGGLIARAISGVTGSARIAVAFVARAFGIKVGQGSERAVARSLGASAGSKAGAGEGDQIPGPVVSASGSKVAGGSGQILITAMLLESGSSVRGGAASTIVSGALSATGIEPPDAGGKRVVINCLWPSVGRATRCSAMPMGVKLSP